MGGPATRLLQAWVGGCALIALAGCVESTMPLGFEPRDRDAAARDAGAGPRKDAAVEDAGSPNDDAGSPNEDAYATYLAWCARETETYVRQRAECLGTTPEELMANGWDRSWCSLWASLILTGALSFDPEAAAACLERRRAAGCANFGSDEGLFAPPWDSTCASSLVGTRGEGEPCTPSVCRPGLFCEMDPEACEGVCRAFDVRRLGEPCAGAPDIICEEGTFCDRFSGSSDSTTCVAWPDSTGDRCWYNCPLGMYCAEQGCALQFPLGAECVMARSGFDSCEGATVDCSGSFGTGYRCTERRKLGESCTPGSHECWSGSFCDPITPSEGVCRFPLKLGDRCNRGPEARCPNGTYCSNPFDPNAVCTKLLPRGSACQESRECETGPCYLGFCDGDTPPPPVECPFG